MSGDRLQGASSGPGSREPSPSVSVSGFDPSREHLLTLYDECCGWHAALDSGAVGNGAFSIRCENGESEQTRLNLRATLRDVSTVIMGMISGCASDERPTGSRPSGLGGDSPASAVDEATSEVEAPRTLLSQSSEGGDPN